MAWPLLAPLVVAAAPKIYEEVIGRPQKRERQAREKLREEQKRAQQSEQRLAKPLNDLGYDEDEPTITEDVIKNARKTVGYDPKKKNIVFAGNVSVGKSSLINGLCNKGGDDDGAARVGSNQVTRNLARYEIPNHPEVVLYDIPGAGTQDVRAFRYYHDQMLYAFDTVVVVHDTTLTEADIRLLQMCIHSGKNCLAVRTKSDNHIRNYAYDKDCELEEAREIFLRETRHDIQSCHKETTAPWPEKEIRIWDYIINSRSVRTFMRGKPSPEEADTAYIDEFDFIFDLSPGLVINPND